MPIKILDFGHLSLYRIKAIGNWVLFTPLSTIIPLAQKAVIAGFELSREMVNKK